MYRMIIFCLTTLCGTFIGIYFSRKVQDRYLFLTELNAFVLRIENLIKYNRYSVYELLSECKSDKLPFITDELIAVSRDGRKIDTQMKREIAKIKYITADDIRALTMLGENLGKTDTDGQISVMESIRGSLDTLIKDSDEIRKNKTKLYRTLGILFGAAVGIIFL